MRDPEYVEAVDHSRWRSYPLTLFAVTEMVHGQLRPAASGPMPLAEALQGAAFEVVDRYPVPPGQKPEDWGAAREQLGIRVMQIALHPRKMVKDIPMPIADQFMRNLPVLDDLRRDAEEIARNHLRWNLVSMHDDFERRANVVALADALGVARTPAAIARS
jgi:hypothetical protein